MNNQSTAIECSVIVKDENKKLVNKYLSYDAFVIDPENTTVKRMIRETMDQFKVDDHADRPSIIFKTSTVIQ